MTAGWRSLLSLLIPLSAIAQSRAPRPDTTTHRVQLVSVAADAKLETLDWGGTGRPVVLLAGLGDNAHVFDHFAPKLADRYHVYGITRRGFSPSSDAASGYLADSLANDVLAVVDSLHLVDPVLIGHSQAGEELSSIGMRNSGRVAGLVYLEAGYDYAFYDESHGNLTIDINEMVRNLERVRFGSGATAAESRSALVALTDSSQTSSLPRFLAWAQSMLRQPVASNAPPRRPLSRVPYAVISGQQKFTAIHGPVLAIFATPTEPPPGVGDDPEMRAAMAEAVAATEQQANAFARGVPQARVVRIAHGNHYVFRTNEAQVLSEIRAFVDALPVRRP